MVYLRTLCSGQQIAAAKASKIALSVAKSNTADYEKFDSIYLFSGCFRSIFVRRFRVLPNAYADATPGEEGGQIKTFEVRLPVTVTQKKRSWFRDCHAAISKS